MSKSFLEGIKNELNDEKSITENGAVGYKTTGKKLLDINFAISSMRSMDEDDIIKKFQDAYFEDKLLAIKWLFFASDVRGGMGERRLFRILIKWLAEVDKTVAKALIKIIPEYNRWDNMLVLMDTELRPEVIKVIKKQLKSDLEGIKSNSSISLLGKWMPSINTSSENTKRLARLIIKDLKMTERSYRKLLSKLRSYLDVVEVSMSSNQWSSIDYEKVPSKANILYKEAFAKHDSTRRSKYLESLKKGTAKINSSVAYPHDIVHKYISNYMNEDTTLEAMWNSLPNYVKDDNGSTICVVDGSASMGTRIGNTDLRASTVANSLGIYFGERLNGEFKNKFITFSMNPRLVDFSKATTLNQKIRIALSNNEVANTNITKVFELILNTAINNRMNQSELPKNIIILSDMEFDSCAYMGNNHSGSYSWNTYGEHPSKTLFDEIRSRYESKGYKLPRLVFWNIASRTGTIPLKENDLGVALVSGFSPSISRMVLSGKLDPFECLLDQLNTKRYELVEKTVKRYLK